MQTIHRFLSATRRVAAADLRHENLHHFAPSRIFSTSGSNDGGGGFDNDIGWDTHSSWSTGIAKDHFNGEAIDRRRELADLQETEDKLRELEAENRKGKAYVDGWKQRMSETCVLLKQVQEPGARGSYLKDSEKAEMYRLHKQNPEVYTVEKLAKDYRIMRQRVHAILWLKELEEEEEKKLGQPLDDSVELLLDTFPEFFISHDREFHVASLPYKPDFKVMPEGWDGITKDLDEVHYEISKKEDEMLYREFVEKMNFNPGVVTFSDAHSTAKTATFTLPAFLSLECEDTKISECVCTRPILPSEYFSIARELESWNHYPSSYSNAVLRAISGLAIAKERDLATWIITNSPRYGVVIDTPMQHHMFLLCCLCFKSILREASVSVSTEKHLGCPVLSQALAWLESQVSILFGANGKSFVLNFVKHCILVGASVLLLFPLGDGEVTEAAASSSKQESQNSDTNGGGIIKDATPAAQREEKNNTDCILDRKISVPQVVAAVAALHERSLLERQIKGFWFSQPSSNYQMVSEHCYLSEKANEERKKRHDYRPIIDYDWFHRQQSSNLETHKEKTREELLAEERDYKRRRMSYRGKKANQSTVQVMRDLIEEYMEEIKLAGGIMSPVKVSEDSEMFPSNLPSGLDIPMAMEANNSRKVSHDSPAVTISNPSYHEQQSRTNYSDKSKAVHDVFSRDYDQHKQGHRRSHYYGEDQQTADQGNHRSHASTSPERHRSHSRSHERRIDHKKQDYSNRKKYNNSSRTRDRWQNDTHRNHISDSFLNNAFSDRYDPSESRKNWEDDISSDDKYVKPDKFSDKELN